MRTIEIERRCEMWWVHALDSKPLFTPEVIKKISDNNWQYYQDGYGGFYGFISSVDGNIDESEVLSIFD